VRARASAIRTDRCGNQVERTEDAGLRTTFLRQVNKLSVGAPRGLGSSDRQADRACAAGFHRLIEDPSQGVSGPLWLRGGIALLAADGFAYEIRNRMTLCRCGASSNKPFCDGSHVSKRIP